MGLSPLVRVGGFKEGEGPNYRPGVLSLRSLKARMVCPTCNSGWMSRLEATIKDTLGGFMDPAWPVVDAAVKAMLQHHAKAIAIWAFKTAQMIDISSTWKEKIFTDGDYQSLKNGLIPSPAIVEIAYGSNPMFSAMLLPEFKAINGGKFFPNQRHARRRGFHFIIQMNHLLLRAAFTPDADPIRIDKRGRSGIQLHPVFIMAQSHSHVFRDIFEFTDAFAIETSAARGAKITHCY